MLILVYIFLGVLLAQLLYIAAKWLQYKRADYRYYFFYIGLLFIYFIIIYSAAIFNLKPADPLYHLLRFFLRPSAFAIYALYFSFGISFLETEIHFPQFHRYILGIRNLLLVFMGTFFVVNALQIKSAWANSLYQSLSLLLFFSVLWLVYCLWKQRSALSHFIIKGGLAAAIGAFISNMLMLIYALGFIAFPNNYLLPLALGIIIEIFFFNSGLTYKSRQIETKMIHSQQQLIVQLEHSRDLENRLNGIRQKISRDLHDELGGGLSTIRLISEMARLKNEPFKDLEKISETSRELLRNMNEIVWTMNANNDNLQSLVTYIRKFSIGYLEELGIECNANVPDAVPEMQVEGFIRRNIFLCVKEALHNVVKHANASRVTIDTSITDSTCSFTIGDNGMGNGAKKPMAGNGMGNMQERMKECGGQFIFENIKGSTVYLSVPLIALSHKSGIAPEK